MSGGFEASQHQGGYPSRRLDPIITVTPHLIEGIEQGRFSDLGNDVKNEIVANGLATPISLGLVDYTRVLDLKPFERWVKYPSDQSLLDRVTYVVGLGVGAAIYVETGNFRYPSQTSNGFTDREERIGWVSLAMEPGPTPD